MSSGCLKGQGRNQKRGQWPYALGQQRTDICDAREHFNTFSPLEGHLLLRFFRAPGSADCPLSPPVYPTIRWGKGGQNLGIKPRITKEDNSKSNELKAVHQTELSSSKFTSNKGSIRVCPTGPVQNVKAFTAPVFGLALKLAWVHAITQHCCKLLTDNLLYNATEGCQSNEGDEVQM